MFFINRMRVERVSLEIETLNNILSASKVIHLSDLHISKFGYREKRLISLVNREKADLILITGDLVVNYKNEFLACVKTLQGLKARYGIFTVFGNSDHTFNPLGHLHDFIRALEENNVTVLNNRHVELRLNGRSLYLVGVDDPFFLFDDLDEAMEGVPFDAPIILLAHSPDILFARAEALVINLLDTPSRKGNSRQWGWEDNTHFSPEDGDVYFHNDDLHTIRVQSRQDGVFIDTILLNPYRTIDDILDSGDGAQIENLLRAKLTHDKHPDLVVIPASGIDDRDIYGKWKRVRDSSTLFDFRLDDLPARREWQYQPLIDPSNYFETNFIARKNMRYHVWIRMKSFNGSPIHDSVFVQFSDSVDPNGRERFRIGKPARSMDRIGKADLILTGHTHGGQIRIPFYGPITTQTSMGRRYTAGLYHHGESSVYISRGIGYSIVPIRLFCPPEITVFTFK